MSDRKVRNDTEAAMAFVLAIESGTPVVVQMPNGDRFEVTTKKLEEPEEWWEYENKQLFPLGPGFLKRPSITYNVDGGVVRAVFTAKAPEKYAELDRLIKATRAAFFEEV